MTNHARKPLAELARQVLDIEMEGLGALRDRFASGEDARALERAVALLAECQGRVVVTGLGKSGLVCRKIAATFSSTGTPAYFLHPVEGAHGDLGLVGSRDVILALSNSGETDELNAILPSLRALGPGVIAMTGRPDSTLARHADVVLNSAVPREACPLDLAPTASTTAALALGDVLAVCLMEWKQFDEQSFRRFHPAGALGRRLALCARELMHTGNMPVASLSGTLGECLQTLHKGGLGAALILDDRGLLAGILTDGDVRRLVVSGRLDPSLPIAQAMTPSPRAGLVDHSAGQLLDIMEEKSITVLPIVEPDGRLAGVVHLHDVLGKGRLKFG